MVIQFMTFLSPTVVGGQGFQPAFKGEQYVSIERQACKSNLFTNGSDKTNGAIARSVV